MIPPTLENSQESLKKEKTTEGRDKVELRNTTDPDEPAGLMDSVTARHVALKCLQDSDPKTSAFPGELPYPCPPSGAKVTHLKDSMKRCSDSLPREGGPTPPKKGHLSTDSLHREINGRNRRRYSLILLHPISLLGHTSSPLPHCTDHPLHAKTVCVMLLLNVLIVHLSCCK
ncbi:hypothetical protein Q7C36_002211 [Tachysurus vachellii]|uniref:Uncharacterized protein n=1 Tax=Tachysurus vachellii TaxID=175792 RepID=A0AA88NYK2_TACVA|nr:hypothetical protein Q7C36_002211 [Tachysurus vachellii]